MFSGISPLFKIFGEEYITHHKIFSDVMNFRREQVCYLCHGSMFNAKCNKNLIIKKERKKETKIYSAQRKPQRKQHLSVYVAEQLTLGHSRSTHLSQILVLICAHILSCLVLQERVSGV